MYRHITSNKSPYKKITYYTSYGDKVAHVHKNSEAYKFFTSSIYKNAIKVGKFTNVVMPIVSNILTSYVVYKKYITNNPNKFNNKKKYITYKKVSLEIDNDNKITLYRAMSNDEYKSLIKTKKFSSNGGMESKWMATSKKNAMKWMKSMDFGESPKIVSIKIPKSKLNGLYFNDCLDDIGPAFCGDINYLNSCKFTIKKVY